MKGFIPIQNIKLGELKKASKKIYSEEIIDFNGSVGGSA